MAIFLDASYFLALYNESDVHHKRAALIGQRIDNNEFGQSLTSDDVFDEALSVALRKFGKEKAQTLGKQILDSVFVLYGNKHIFYAAFKIFNESKELFSFTDCISQSIMELAQIQYIATFDKLFGKLDFEIIN